MTMECIYALPGQRPSAVLGLKCLLKGRSCPLNLNSPPNQNGLARRVVTVYQELLGSRVGSYGYGQNKARHHNKSSHTRNIDG